MTYVETILFQEGYSKSAVQCMMDIMNGNSGNRGNGGNSGNRGYRI